VPATLVGCSARHRQDARSTRRGCRCIHPYGLFGRRCSCPAARDRLDRRRSVRRIRVISRRVRRPSRMWVTLVPMSTKPHSAPQLSSGCSTVPPHYVTIVEVHSVPPPCSLSPRFEHTLFRRLWVVAGRTSLRPHVWVLIIRLMLSIAGGYYP
jgi:hypothetical protein